MRTETDFLGEVEIPDEALYGIHAFRAAQNFPDITRFQKEWYCATGTVKKACYLAYLKFAGVVTKRNDARPVYPLISSDIINAMTQAAGEIEKGLYFDQFIVPALQGGAGTSINMNINEIICNRALLLNNHNPGAYQFIHPIEHANIFQSTNDVIPTSLKVALLKLLKLLTTSINDLRHSLEEIEKNAQDHLRCAYTEMQEAVPSTYGRLFSTYNEAFSRDWWRTSKCSERIKTVNIGGSAIGSGITVPGLFIRDVVIVLQEITGLPVCRAENLHDATCNLDSLVEVHAILKAHAVNLEKMVSDIRLLSSDLMINREIQIPKIQTGSSIMPGKVNPVIPEFVISASHKIYANDQLISSLAGQGNLDLNAYIPVIGHAMIESVQLLIACDDTLNTNLVKGIQINRVNSLENLLKYPSIVTALVPYIGYIKAAELADEMRRNNINLFEANKIKGAIDEDKIKRIISPANLLKEGFSLNDLSD